VTDTYNPGSDVRSKVEQKSRRLVSLEVHGHFTEWSDRQHVLRISHL